MRSFILTLAVVGGLLLIPASHAGSISSGLGFGTATLDAHAIDAQQPPQINVEINKSSGGRMWYANPIWIAIGALALVMLTVLIVMAAKGGGTTVVKG